MSFFRRCLGNLCGDSQVARPLSARQEPAPGLSISVLEHHSQLDFIKETFPAMSRWPAEGSFIRDVLFG